MKNKVVSTLKIIFGVVLLLLGIIGNLLPIIPGVLLMAAGALLLADEIPWVHQKLERLEARYPKLRSIMRRLRKEDGSLNFQKLAVILIGLSLVSAAISYAIIKLL